MTNPFYTATGAPVQESRGTSPAVRNEFSLLQTAMDGVFAAIDIGAASGTSTTSLLVGTGSKSFTIQAGRAFSPGQSVVLAYNVTPTTQMTGTITSYNRTTGAVVMNVTGTNGSGTYADWTLSLSPSGGATLGANVFTGVQDWATGANIASASTINLDTATGNRVHITGTTTITAVTLTRGPRTVIFDGVLTLTHHATNNNLPGAANITTAAGDRAIYESDGTTVYCVSYIRANGTAVVAAGAGYTQIASFTLSGTAASISFTGINSEDILIVSNGVTNDTGPVALNMAVSTNNGGAYGSSRSVGPTGFLETTARYGSIAVTGLKTGFITSVCAGVSSTAFGTSSGVTSDAAGVNQFAVGAQVNAIRLTPGSGANFNGTGTITIYGRG